MEAAKIIIRAYAKQFLFWMLFFAFTRMIFLICYSGQLKGIDVVSIIAVFWHALHLDFSAACFVMMLPFVLLVIQSLWNNNSLNWIHRIYSGIIIFVYSAISVGEIGVYEEWRTKLHFKALLYLLHPDEIINTAETWVTVMLIVIFLITVAGSYLAWYKWFFVKITSFKRSWIFSSAFLLGVSFMTIIGVRGGFQQIPINQSESYFSKHEILNLAAVNSGWNLAHSVVQNYNAMGKNPFVYYKPEQVKETINRIYHSPCDSTTFVLTTPRPNIVMFILEGWSADLVPELGGDPGIAPFFSSLVKDGVLFTDIYSSGTRSQQGMAAIFSGYPSEAYTTVTNEPEKYRKLPSLVKKLDSCGYHTSFLFGGQLNYGNMKSYMYFNGFDRITEGADMDASLPRGKLGVHDEYTFPLLLKNIEKDQKPFFASIFTMSTHSPYDQKMDEPIQKYSIEKKYVNSAYYTDGCLKKFFEEAKNKSWYSNTLFVFISDHGHSTYKDRDYYSPAYHKIALMFYGDVIREECHGMKISKTASQVDFPATMLPQLGIKCSEFRWSKNMLDPCSPEFAYFSFEVGVGWIRPCGYYVEECRIKQIKYLESHDKCAFPKDTLIKEGRSYLQGLYQDYLDL